MQIIMTAVIWIRQNDYNGRYWNTRQYITVVIRTPHNDHNARYLITIQGALTELLMTRSLALSVPHDRSVLCRADAPRARRGRPSPDPLPTNPNPDPNPICFPSTNTSLFPQIALRFWSLVSPKRFDHEDSNFCPCYQKKGRELLLFLEIFVASFVLERSCCRRCHFVGAVWSLGWTGRSSILFSK